MRSKKEVNVYICKRENKKRYGVLVQYTAVEYYKINITPPIRLLIRLT